MKATYDQVYALRLRCDPIFRRLPEWLWMAIWKVVLHSRGWTHDEWFEEFSTRFFARCSANFVNDVVAQFTRSLDFNDRRNRPLQ
jgi:hypothetical protein